MVVVAVALVAAADQLSSSGPLGFAAIAALSRRAGVVAALLAPSVWLRRERWLSRSTGVGFSRLAFASVRL